MTCFYGYKSLIVSQVQRTYDTRFPMSSIAMPRKLAAILHADVAGYSRLMGADEEATFKRLTEYRALMSDRINRRAGEVVDTAGDSLLAVFSSVMDATNCALEVQHLLKNRNAELPPDRRLEFRMGIELGDVLQQDDAVYGDGVNVAARIQALAEPGGICVSDAARRAVSKQLPVSFESLGEHAVKNIAEPVRVFRLVPQADWLPSQIDSRPVSRKARISILSIVVVGGLMAALAGLLAVWVLSQKDTSKPDKTAESQTTPPANTPASESRMAFSVPEVPSIAVLPFKNMSGDAGQDYFGDGLTDNIITSLSQLEKLFVIARNSVFSYKGRPVQVQKVAEDLGIRFVLEGSFQRSGDRIRIHAQLIDALNGRNLWADRYDTILTDLFTVQDQVTQKIVSALQVQLTEQERKRLASRYTESYQAYDDFLRGQALYGRFNKEDNTQARAMFETAINLDPEFARAYGSLALTHVEDYRERWSKQPESSAKKAIEFAEKAIELDNTLAQIHFVRSFVYLTVERRFDEARTQAKKAIELDHNFADGYNLLGTIYTYLDDLDEAIRLIQKGLRLNPHAPSRYFGALGRAHYFKGQYEQAIAALKKAIEKNPAYIQHHIYLAAAYQQAGQTENASWEVVEILALAPDFSIRAWLDSQPFNDPTFSKRLLINLQQAGVP